MRRWWVRWIGQPAQAFTLHWPYWCSGWRMSSSGIDRPIFVAAIIAPNENAAKETVRLAHDNPDAPLLIEWSFCNERGSDWSPFCDRFPRAPWMQWPDVGGEAFLNDSSVNSGRG